MKLTTSVIILLTTILLKNAHAENKKIKVTVLYESLCPDSQNFIQSQLYRNYEQIKDKIELNLVPFGKSRSHNRDNKILFTCQHGRDECNANKYQNCVLNLLPDQDSQVLYVSCAMKFYYDLDHCAENVTKVDMNKVNECRNGDLGTELQLAAEKVTTPVINQSFFVPTIVFNDQYDQAKSWKALNNFKKVVDELSGGY